MALPEWMKVALRESGTTVASNALTAEAVSWSGQEVVTPVSPAGALPGVASQPAPKHVRTPSVALLVHEDLRARVTEGLKRYGTPLQPFNGRDALLDAYQEAIDLVLYLRQAIYERDGE